MRTLLSEHAVLVLILILLAVWSPTAQARESNHRQLSPPNVSGLIQELQNPELQSRRNAACELSRLSTVQRLPPETIPALVQALKDPDPTVRVQQCAITALASGGAAAIPELKPLLKDNGAFNVLVRVDAVHALGSIAQSAPQAWPVLIATFKDPYLQPWASIEVAKVGAPIVPLLARALDDKSPGMRKGAVEALQMGPGAAKDATSGLVEALQDPSPSIRALAAEDLGRIGPAARSAVPALSAALKDSRRYVRDEAAVALAKIDPSDDLPLPNLIGAVEYNQSVAHWDAVDALSGMGANARAAAPVLEKLLATDPDPRFRVAIAGAIGPIVGASAAPALARALTDDKDAQVRLAALTAIARLGADDAAAIAALVRALSDRDQAIRDAAADTLAALGKPATPALIAALQSPDLYTRQWAIQALAKTKPLTDEIVRALTAAASGDKSIVVRYDAANILDRAGVAGGHAALEKAQQETGAAMFESPAIDTTRLYSRPELLADLPPDNDNEYPLHLFYLTSYHEPKFAMLVAVYRGRDRRDRLIFWKKAGAGKFRELQAIDAGPDGSDTFDPPKIMFIPKGQVPGSAVRIVQVGINLWRGHGDYIFAIDGDELRPVEIESPEKWYSDKLRPGEEVVRPVENSFCGHKAEFRFYVRSGKKTAQVVGSYKLVREVVGAAGNGFSFPFATQRTIKPPPRIATTTTTWKLAVDSARLEAIPSR
ncbi:MAG TPA: HEAT repeat domain-containing protein [Candidatus Binataceae bacterium]|nr:HEAT repeat domain-containing protein [Candidatus Binataceae bacterium]